MFVLFFLCCIDKTCICWSYANTFLNLESCNRGWIDGVCNLEISQYTAYRCCRWFFFSTNRSHDSRQNVISRGAKEFHYNDVIMNTIASQLTSLAIVYSIVYSGADQSKHQSTASLAFVWGIHRGTVNSPHKGPVTRKMFPFDDVIILQWLDKPVLRLSCGCRYQFPLTYDTFQIEKGEKELIMT